MVDGSWTPNDTEHKFPGMMTDLVLADCYLPESPVKQGYFHQSMEGTPAAGLVISVSNDGDHRSKENLTFISYDSACMSCNISSGCVLKVNVVFRSYFVENKTKNKPCVQKSSVKYFLSWDRGGVAAVVRSSTIGPLNNRTIKRNKQRGVKTIELLPIAVQ